MPTLNLQRRLPQRYALTGRGGRTGLEQIYAQRGRRSPPTLSRRRTTASALTTAPDTPQPSPSPPDLGLTGETIVGPGGDVPGSSGTPQTAEGFIGQMAGDELAAMFGFQGLRGGLRGGLYGLLAGAPLSAYPAGLLSAITSGMLGPAMLGKFANRAGGIGMAASDAAEEAGLVQGMGFDPVTQGLSQIAAYQSHPHTITGYATQGLGFGNPGASDIGAQIGAGQFGIGQGVADPFGQGQTITSGPVAGSQTNPAITSALEQATGIPSEALEGSMGAGGFGEDVAAGGPSAAMGISLGHADPASATAMGIAGGVDSGSSSGGNVGSGGFDTGPGSHGGDGGDGGGGGTVLCTVLFNKGIMPDYIYVADRAYASFLPQQTIDGYRVWATHVAKLMEKSDAFLKIMTPPIMSWAKHMSGRPTIFGSICEKVGIPVCKIIGWVKNRSKE